MRARLIVAAALGLAACAPRVPDSGAGVGFGDYNSYVRGATPLAATPPATPPATSFSPDAAAAAIDQAAGVGIAPTGTTPTGTVGAPLSAVNPATGIATTPSDAELFDPNRPRGDAPSTIAPQSGEVAYATQGLSDEQSFAAVTQRETIASDAERIAQNRARYVVIPPGAIPQRPDNTGPDIVKYALATTNPVGAKLYDRPAFYLVNLKTACSKFTSPDFAQQAFLAAGGPLRDPKGLDPDGDGFACDWDPTPFRNALKP
jgi:hypothetical protein